MNILLADDHPDIIAVTTTMLEQEGFKVRAALDGKRALKLLEEENPDLVILDIRMPEINGLELARKLKADPETSSIPVLLLTARIQYDEVRAGYHARADYYLKKPFTKADLMSAVKSLLGQDG